MIIIKDNAIKIKQATQLGYIEIPVMEGKTVADLSFPTSKLRRGRVQEEGKVCPTITTTGGCMYLKR